MHELTEFQRFLKENMQHYQRHDSLKLSSFWWKVEEDEKKFFNNLPDDFCPVSNLQFHNAKMWVSYKNHSILSWRSGLGPLNESCVFFHKFDFYDDFNRELILMIKNPEGWLEIGA